MTGQRRAPQSTTGTHDPVASAPAAAPSAADASTAAAPKAQTPATPPNAAPSAASNAAPSTVQSAAPEPDSHIPDDVAFGMEELPAGFWDTPAVPAAETGPGPTTAPPEPMPGANEAAAPAATSAPVTQASRAATVHAHADASADETLPPTELEEAFTQLQSLFPGRVVEVTATTAEDAAGSRLIEPSGDELAPEDGYDEDDQDRLSFGPSGT